MRIIDLFFKNADKNPGKTAVICEDKAVSYAQLMRSVNKLSHYLDKNGIRRGDHIGVLLPNSFEFATLILAAANTGVALVPLCPTLPANAIERAFAASDAKHIIKPENVTEADNMPDTPFDNTNITGDELLILTLTSGSTGEPKPIMLTQQNKLNRAFAAAKLYDVTENDIVLAATPLYHSLAERLFLLPMLLGGTAIIMQRYTPALWLSYVKEHSVSFTIAVSSQLAQIAQILTSPFLPEISSLRCLVSSSALLEPHIKTELLKKLNCELHECYGTSEIAIATSINITDSKTKYKSVGCAVHDIDIKILKADGDTAAPGEKGEIACKTPLLFSGYYKLPELTKACMYGEYFKTGDIGYLDNDGFLYYVDREKDLIITGAINVFPSDIESVILQLKSVKQCVAFPLHDDRLGEIIAVAIIPADNEEFKERDVKFHCAKNLADYQQPRKYYITDSFPENKMGKLMKRELINRLTEHQ